MYSWLSDDPLVLYHLPDLVTARLHVERDAAYTSPRRKSKVTCTCETIPWRIEEKNYVRLLVVVGAGPNVELGSRDIQLPLGFVADISTTVPAAGWAPSWLNTAQPASSSSNTSYNQLRVKIHGLGLWLRALLASPVLHVVCFSGLSCHEGTTWYITYNVYRPNRSQWLYISCIHVYALYLEIIRKTPHTVWNEEKTVEKVIILLTRIPRCCIFRDPLVLSFMLLRGCYCGLHVQISISRCYRSRSRSSYRAKLH